MPSPIVIGLVVLVCCALLATGIYFATSSSAPSPGQAPTGGSPSPSGGLPSGSPGPAPSPPAVPSGMIKGKIVKIARADNRDEYINLLGIDVFDQSGSRITSGITPTFSEVYANDPSHFGPQFLIDGVHQENGSNGLRLPHTNNTRNSYMQLDLGQDTVISKIVIYNRTACCTDRINGCNLTVTNASGTNVLTIPLNGSKAVYTFGTPLTNASTSSTYVPEPYDYTSI